MTTIYYYLQSNLSCEIILDYAAKKRDAKEIIGKNLYI